MKLPALFEKTTYMQLLSSGTVSNWFFILRTVSRKVERNVTQGKRRTAPPFKFSWQMHARILIFHFFPRDISLYRATVPFNSRSLRLEIHRAVHFGFFFFSFVWKKSAQLECKHLANFERTVSEITRIYGIIPSLSMESIQMILINVNIYPNVQLNFVGSILCVSWWPFCELSMLSYQVLSHFREGNFVFITLGNIRLGLGILNNVKVANINGVCNRCIRVFVYYWVYY